MTKRRIQSSQQCGLVAKDIAEILKLGKDALVTVEEFKRPRTYEQLKKVNAIASDFAKSQSQSHSHMKVLLKDYLGQFEIVTRSDGAQLKRYDEWGGYSLEKLSETIDRLQALAAEYHVELRDH